MKAYEYGEPIDKTITPKNVRWSHATLDSVLLNETLCLHRLRGAPNFPQLLATNWETHTITMTYQGRSLHWYWKRGIRPTIYNPLEQLEDLYSTLQARGIVHLDILPNGQNFCLHEGQLSIIDYGIAVRDGAPISSRIHSLLEKFHSDGGYEHYTHTMLSQIYERCEVKKSAKRQR